MHECSHGWVAYRCGDPTAKSAGRLTLNPLKHIDPVGTVILPGTLLILRFLGYQTFVFGWAKPVPVNFARLRHPRRDMMIVGLAGPLTNIALAFLFSRLVFIPGVSFAHPLLGLAIYVNLLLAVFNLVPVPPLDGSRFVMWLLPSQLARRYAMLEQYGILIIMALLYFGFLDKIIYPAVIVLGFLMGVDLR